MFWTRKKQMLSEEYESCLTRMRNIEDKNAGLSVNLDRLETQLNSLRGLINRKLGKHDFADVEDQEGAKNSDGRVSISKVEYDALIEFVKGMK